MLGLVCPVSVLYEGVILQGVLSHFYNSVAARVFFWGRGGGLVCGFFVFFLEGGGSGLAFFFLFFSDPSLMSHSAYYRDIERLQLILGHLPDNSQQRTQPVVFVPVFGMVFFSIVVNVS